MARTPELQRFYGSKRWRDLRERLVIERLGRCERCGKDCSGDLSQLIAHHKQHLTDENLADPEIAVNPDNVEILCAHCHSLEHRVKGFIKKRKEVFIVYGSPLSGKSTYVRQNMEPGDLVFDMDAIGSAISYQPLYKTPPEIKTLTFAVRDFLFDQVRIRNGGWQTAWIIAGLPRKNDRERLAARLGASLILIESTAEECHKRLFEADDGRYPEWSAYIDSWFKDYQA